MCCIKDSAADSRSFLRRSGETFSWFLVATSYTTCQARDVGRKEHGKQLSANSPKYYLLAPPSTNLCDTFLLSSYVIMWLTVSNPSVIIKSVYKKILPVVLFCSQFSQEGWLSPTERATVSAISLRHIMASPEYAPGTIAVGPKCHMGEKEDSTCQTHVPFYLQPFSSNSTPNFESSPF